MKTYGIQYISYCRSFLYLCVLNNYLLYLTLQWLKLKLEYFSQTSSIPWRPMPWFLASPVHQQPWYCLYSINGCLSSIRSLLVIFHHLIPGKQEEVFLMFLEMNSTQQGLSHVIILACLLFVLLIIWIHNTPINKDAHFCPSLCCGSFPTVRDSKMVRVPRDWEHYV